MSRRRSGLTWQVRHAEIAAATSRVPVHDQVRINARSPDELARSVCRAPSHHSLLVLASPPYVPTLSSVLAIWDGAGFLGEGALAQCRCWASFKMHPARLTRKLQLSMYVNLQVEQRAADVVAVPGCGDHPAGFGAGGPRGGVHVHPGDALTLALALAIALNKCYCSPDLNPSHNPNSSPSPGSRWRTSRATPTRGSARLRPWAPTSGASTPTPFCGQSGAVIPRGCRQEHFTRQTRSPSPVI